jgi:ankyrin repeat protein
LGTLVSVSTWNSKGNQPLHEAVIKGNIPVINLLLNYGADINSARADKKAPIHLAVSSPKVLGQLLKARPAVSLKDQLGNTALHLLLQQVDWWMDGASRSIMNDLLLYDADINTTNDAGESPFHLLLGQVVPGSEERLRILLDFLDHSPDISQPMLNGSLPFRNLLKNLKPFVNTKRAASDEPSLESRCLERFLSLGADADTVVIEGSPLLHYCLENGQKPYRPWVMLIVQRADVNLAGHDGNHPLHQILRLDYSSFSQNGSQRRLDYITALIGRNANVNQLDARGASPLEIALNNKDLAWNMMVYVTPLLEAGAVPMLVTSKGESMFDLIEKIVHPTDKLKVMKTLLEADLALKTELPNSAPSWARSWRAACYESQWIVAKNLIQFEDPISRPSSMTFLNCAFIVIAENLLREHKAQLVLWQAGKLELEAARTHRQEYIAILKDWSGRGIDIEPLWYKYLLEVMDLG